MENKVGYVYILTNPSFREDWVKIGKSSRPVDVRAKELDNTAVPLPYDIYAILRTTKFNEVERLVHKTIDRLTDLRIRQGREFFNIKPAQALDILRDISLTLDDAVILRPDEQGKLVPEQDCKREKKENEKVRHPARSNFRFSMIGVQEGEEIEFIPTKIKVRVADDNHIEYQDRIFTLSAFTGTYMPEEKRIPSAAYQGPAYFTYKGKKLTDLRKEKESLE